MEAEHRIEVLAYRTRIEVEPGSRYELADPLPLDARTSNVFRPRLPEGAEWPPPCIEMFRRYFDAAALTSGGLTGSRISRYQWNTMTRHAFSYVYAYRYAPRAAGRDRWRMR